MTNGERIRKMSNEELAKLLNRIIWDCDGCMILEECTKNHFKNCERAYLQWLSQEVKR